MTNKNGGSNPVGSVSGEPGFKQWLGTTLVIILIGLLMLMFATGLGFFIHLLTEAFNAGWNWIDYE